MPSSQSSIRNTETMFAGRPVEGELFNRQRLARNILWFVIVTVLALAVLLVFNRGGETIKALHHLEFTYFLFCFFLLFIDLMLGSWRNHIFIRKLKPKLSHWVSFRANVANMFMGAITPAHSGAGPAQLYVYTRHGVSLLDAFTVSLVNMGATLIYMPLAGLVAILALEEDLASGIVPHLLRYGFGFFSLVLAGFLLAFWKPQWIGGFVCRFAKWLSALLPRKKEALEQWSRRLQYNIETYQQTCRFLLRKNPYLFPLSLFITTVLYLNKYVMQYFIILGLGISASLPQVVAIQVLIQFMIYFAPSPGGSGFAEMSIAVLFGKMVPAALLPLFTLLQRSYLLFIPAVLGAVVVIRLLQRHAVGVRPEGYQESKTDVPSR